MNERREPVGWIQWSRAKLHLEVVHDAINPWITSLTSFDRGWNNNTRRFCMFYPADRKTVIHESTIFLSIRRVRYDSVILFHQPFRFVLFQPSRLDSLAFPSEHFIARDVYFTPAIPPLIFPSYFISCIVVARELRFQFVIFRIPRRTISRDRCLNSFFRSIAICHFSLLSLYGIGILFGPRNICSRAKLASFLDLATKMSIVSSFVDISWFSTSKRSICFETLTIRRGYPKSYRS